MIFEHPEVVLMKGVEMELCEEMNFVSKIKIVGHYIDGLV